MPDPTTPDMFALIPGLRPVDPHMLDAFRRQMRDVVIPQMVRNERDRIEAAARVRAGLFGAGECST